MIRHAIQGRGRRRHVLLATVTLCGLPKAAELMFLEAFADMPSCSNCQLKLERLQARTRRFHQRLRRKA